MLFRIQDLRLHIDQDEAILKVKAAKALGISEDDILSYRIVKESIDARDKQNIFFHYTIDATLADDNRKFKAYRNDKIERLTIEDPKPIIHGSRMLIGRPVIVGAGPAGLHAGLLLSKEGYNPILIERGNPIEKRDSDVSFFWQHGKLNVNSNIQFGEGGAGTYSDGKLTTRIKDARCGQVLNSFIDAGAPESIRYSSKAHIGTDLLKNVVKSIRRTIIENGGEFHFDAQLQHISRISEGTYDLALSNGDIINTSCVILAIGHSARDTYEMLKETGFPITPKPFAIGLRIEHSQNWLDKRQYGPYAGNPKLGAADYKLTFQDKETGRGVYTFCMCPGGLVVAAASEEGGLVTNGMSYHKRNGVNCNSAIVATISLNDFDSNEPLSGVNFQREWECKAFDMGGSNYKAPAQRVGDFAKGLITEQWGSIIPTYSLGVNPVDLASCLPHGVAKSIQNSLKSFNAKIPGFGIDDAVLTGIETRTSSPIRITREDDLMVKGFDGIYAAGEGAGYAGGIISAAVDGIKAAESVISRFKS